MTATAARSQPRLTIADSDPMKNACHEKPIFTRTMSPFGDLYNLYVLIALSSLARSRLRTPDPTASPDRAARTTRLPPVQSLLRQVCVASGGGDRCDRVRSVSGRSSRTSAEVSV